MESKPRYSRISDIIDLAIYMASKVQGVTLNDIMQRYNIGRRTAERMRDSLTCIFPQIDEIETTDRLKHWGFQNYSLNYLVSFSPKEIADIEQCLRRTTNKELKKELSNVVEKLKVLNKKNSQSMENSLEMIMQTEGYAVRQMPQYKIDLSSLEVIRESFKTSRIVEGFYHGKKRIIEPLGMVYGEKIYLVAREKAKGKDIYNYLLHKFENLKLTEKTFDKGDFNLQEYTNQSFGVYHGEILNVKLSFSKELAKDAALYNFHPTQKIKQENDGSLTVTFKASGDKEIIWHVFKWGAGCKIVSPSSLKKQYKKFLEDNLKNYKKD